MIDYVWLIPLVPLVGAVLNGLLGARYFHSERTIGMIACAVMAIAFVIAAGAFVQLASMDADHRHHETVLFDWIPAGVAQMQGDETTTAAAVFNIPFAFQYDQLSAIMALIITGVGLLIHIYATGYMHGDAGFFRFFTYLNLFVAFMLVLVLGNSYAMMFIGWEGVGLCSYLLIGYHYGKKSAGDAGKKAFVVNRIGDAGFLLAILTIFFTFGTLDYDQVFEAASANFEVGATLMTVIALLLFVGACGKSAQIPLYTWLPDAMEGPTPVSALIHAATMVTAGVYMVVRSNIIYSLSPTAMMVVAVTGGVTALFAASIALVQNDIKRVLAYSTISQLGYMFLACGVGAFAAGIFHLMTHAFFKALLFLAAGSVMHALADELNMWKMGNVKKYMPITHKTFLVGTLAIAGVPGLAGFFSKDEILWMAWSGPNGSPFLWFIGASAAALTAFYMTRLLLVTFYGKSRMDPDVEAHAHESPGAMAYPLVVLAILAVLGGYVGIPAPLRVGPLGWAHDAGNIYDWLGPITHEDHGSGAESEAHGRLMLPTPMSLGKLADASSGSLTPDTMQVASINTWQASLTPVAQLAVQEEHAAESGHNTRLELVLMAASVLLAGAGIALAYQMYVRDPLMPERLQERFRAAHRVLTNKYFVDELYDAVVVNRTKDLGTALWVADDAVVDGVVNGTAHSTLRAGSASDRFDGRVVDGAVNGVGYGMWRSSRIFRFLQTGFVQNYALIIVLGAFLLVSAYLFF